MESVQVTFSLLDSQLIALNLRWVLVELQVYVSDGKMQFLGSVEAVLIN